MEAFKDSGTRKKKAKSQPDQGLVTSLEDHLLIDVTSDPEIHHVQGTMMIAYAVEATAANAITHRVVDHTRFGLDRSTMMISTMQTTALVVAEQVIRDITTTRISGAEDVVVAVVRVVVVVGDVVITRARTQSPFEAGKLLLHEKKK